MNAIAEPVMIPPGSHAPVLPAADPAVRDGILDIPGEMALYHGGRLSSVRVAWRMVGPANAPVVCALGGISASRHVCFEGPRHCDIERRGASETRHRETERSGWWSEVAGAGRPLDTHRYRVLSFDYLGGSGDTTGPRAAEAFPSISTFDQAELLLRLVDHLGIKALRAIVGGSYGGMVALAFGERCPERVGRLIVLCAAQRPARDRPPHDGERPRRGRSQARPCAGDVDLPQQRGAGCSLRRPAGAGVRSLRVPHRALSPGPRA